MDYIMGLLLIVSPWLFNFYRGAEETWVPVILGASTIIYSTMTNYELGVSHTLSMRTHLTLDFFSGVLLAVSPWLFGFADWVWAPHLILGVLEICAALMTKRESTSSRENLHRHTAAMH